MIDAGIHSGDMLVVRQQPLADHRDIVVALLNDEATVKRLHYRNGEISLLPANTRFKPIPVGPEDDFRIVGKVVAVRRSAKK
jgi:repressor LexA